MKKLIIIILFVVISPFMVMGQQLYMEAGKSLSLFDYENSKGKELKNIYSSSHSFMSFGYRNEMPYNGFNSLMGFSLAGYGAIGSDNGTGYYMEWDLSYLGMDIALDYDIVKVRNTRFYVRGGSSISILIQGTQTLNNQVYKVNRTEEFGSPLINFKGGVGYSYSITRSIEFYSQYTFSKSLNMKSSNAELPGKEKLSIVSHNFGFGILLEAPTYPYRHGKFR